METGAQRITAEPRVRTRGHLPSIEENDMTQFRLGAELNRAAKARSITQARWAVEQARKAGTPTTCCQVHYKAWCRPGCRNFAMNGAAPQLVWS